MRVILGRGCSLLRSFPTKQAAAATPLLVRLASRQQTAAVVADPGGAAVWGSRKQHRRVKLHFPLDMTDPGVEEQLAPLRARVKQQVRCPRHMAFCVLARTCVVGVLWGV